MKMSTRPNDVLVVAADPQTPTEEEEAARPLLFDPAHEHKRTLTHKRHLFLPLSSPATPFLERNARAVWKSTKRIKTQNKGKKPRRRRQRRKRKRIEREREPPTTTQRKTTDMDDAERLAARASAQAGMRPGSAFDCLLPVFEEERIGYRRKEAGVKEGDGQRDKSGDNDDEDDAEPVPPPETVEAALWPENVKDAVFDAIDRQDAPKLRRLLRFLTRVYDGQANAREKIHGEHYGLTALSYAVRR
jgi:hypothetical protein